jgi:hypothetical protein
LEAALLKWEQIWRQMRNWATWEHSLVRENSSIP